MVWSLILNTEATVREVRVEGGSSGLFLSPGAGVSTDGLTIIGMEQQVFSGNDHHHVNLKILGTTGLPDVNPWVLCQGDDAIFNSVTVKHANLDAGFDIVEITGNRGEYGDWKVDSNTDGIALTGADRNLLTGWHIEVGGVNVNDGIALVASDFNLIDSITVHSTGLNSARYGVNITDAASNDNYVGVVHAPDAATAVLNDLGTNTIVLVTTAIGQLLADGSVDSIGTQRFTGDPSVIYGAAGDTQLRWDEEANAWVLAIGNNANAFTNRLRFRSSDDANAHDIELLDGDGTTVKLQWDDSADHWLSDDFNPNLDRGRDLGSATLTWRDLYIDKIKDNAGVEIYVPEVSTFSTTHRFIGSLVALILGAAGDSQLDFEEQVNGWALRIGDNADAFTARLEFNSSDHADAHDILVYDGDGVTVTLRWDESDDRWKFTQVPLVTNLTDGGAADALHTHAAVGAHTIASHSDTTGTGAELDELTDGSTTTLHAHAGGGGAAAEDSIPNILMLGGM